jgi:hypothetical protein
MSAGMIYCLDTSALIAGYHRIYPYTIFGGLWNEIDGLIEARRLFSSEEVYKELEYQKDSLFEWAKERKQMFLRADLHEQAFLTQIATTFPGLATSKTSANTADPFVIAQAKIHGRVLITEERRLGSVKNPKIPLICQHFGVTYEPFLTIIKKEGWTFP